MAWAIAGVYRNMPLDLSKGGYFSFYKKVEVRVKGENWRALFAAEDIKAGEVCSGRGTRAPRHCWGRTRDWHSCSRGLAVVRVCGAMCACMWCV